MSELNLNGCPVCGSPQESGNQARCPVCGTANAFTRKFASRDSFVTWKIGIDSRNDKLIKAMQSECDKRGVFTLSNKGIACISPVDAEYQFISGNIAEIKEKGVEQFSSSERHQVILLKDGKMKAEGDNDYGQCNVTGLSGVTNICAAARCTYGVTKEGRVLYAGAPVSTEVNNWNDISKVVCGSYHIVGLTRNGTVKIAGSVLDDNMKMQVQSWSNIINISAGADCVAALRADGKVLFAGKVNDSRKEAESWSNIAAIAVESVYLVGLTKSGRVLLAGTCKNAFLDLGRSEARNWKDIVAISCSRSGIAALGKDGKLYVAGNVQGIGAIKEAYKKNCESSMRINLIKSVGLN